MELFLNFSWALLTIASVCLWMRMERRIGAERRLPLVALALLIVILFPVISVSDDLQVLQNPAESDTFSASAGLPGRQSHAVHRQLPLSPSRFLLKRSGVFSATHG